MKISSEPKPQYLIRFVIFFLIFLGAFVCVSQLLRPENIERPGFQGFYAERANTLDMVYIGSSCCITYWAPYEAWNETGIASYAYGCSDMSAQSVLPLVKNVLRRQSPELLIIDLRAFQKNCDTVSEGSVLVPATCMPLFSKERFELLHRCLPYLEDTSADNKLMYYFDLIRYHGNWNGVNSIRNSIRYVFPGQVESETKGFLSMPFHKIVELPDQSGVTERLPVVKVSEECLNELLNYLSKSEQKALFIVPPYVESEYERRQYNYLSDIVNSYDFDYINANDYYEDIGLDETRDYYNETHTNIFGAEKYTRFLSRYLDEQYSLPDRRQDAEYAQWNDGYATWVTLSDAVKSKIEELIETGDTVSD